MPRGPRFIRHAAVLTAAVLGVAVVAGPPVASQSQEPVHADGTVDVRPIDWPALGGPEPSGDRAELARDVLSNTNRYALQTWFPSRFGDQTGRYLDLGGSSENDIRGVGSEAFGLASSLRTGAYDADATGVTAADAEAISIRLSTSAAHHHRANGGTWGDVWQSALWAYYAGFAAWMVWPELTPYDQEQVARMVEHEADRFLDYDVPYFRNEDGTVNFPGDSKAEENAWNANLLQLATAMMPDHPHADAWMDKNLELMVSAFARPADGSSNRIVNGRRLSRWLEGSNAADDGTLVNHGFIHPDYMATVAMNTNAVLPYSLAGMPTPEAAFVSADVVYDALVDHVFPSPPYDAPGGTVYVDDSSDIYYPQGNDWGTHRRAHFALVDAQASLFGFDDLASTSGAAWERLHAQMVLDMQSRFADGRTYGARSEDTYAGREEWVAVHAAQIWLSHWLTARDAVHVSNRPMVTGEIELDTPSRIDRNEPAVISATFRADAVARASSVELGVDSPPGWKVTPLTATRAGSVKPGEQFVARWQVEAGSEAAPGPVDLHASAHWTALGGEWTRTDTAVTVIVPDPPTGTAQLSDHPWVSASNGFGPVEPLRHENYYGDPLAIQGQLFDRGLWVHAPGAAEFYLGGQCSRLTATVGIDDSMAAFGARRGSVEFRVVGDGEVRYDSGLVRGDTAAVPVEVDVTGVRDLRLVVTDGGVDGQSFDHAVWGAPVVDCASG